MFIQCVYYGVGYSFGFRDLKLNYTLKLKNPVIGYFYVILILFYVLYISNIKNLLYCIIVTSINLFYRFFNSILTLTNIKIA